MSEPSEAAPAIALRDIYKTYEMGGAPVAALRGVDVDVARGEFVAVMGPSGSGKSTLLHVLGLVDTDYKGTYELAGRRVSGHSSDELATIRNREIGFIFQAFFLLPQMSILDNAALPALYAREKSPEECREIARARLEEMGLGNRVSHKPTELSIGQRQRAAIARALINNPSVLLADEPTGALDSKTAREILEIFTELHRRGSTIIMITHDNEVAAAAERSIHVRDGQIHL
jgi:putative ABC transport system ATP-binding protein